MFNIVFEGCRQVQKAGISLMISNQAMKKLMLSLACLNEELFNIYFKFEKEIHFCILICIRIAHSNLDMLKTSDFQRVYNVCYIRHVSNVWCSLEREQNILNFDTSWGVLTCDSL